MPHELSRKRGIADMAGLAGSMRPVEIDPKRSSMGTPQDRVQKTDPSFFEIA
jgi:hypothetical protein